MVPRAELEGVDTALRAFTYIRGALGDARFVLIGTGPEKKRLMALAHLRCGFLG